VINGYLDGTVALLLSQSTPWWQEAVFYHIYVRSFLDTDGDGIGDLPGVLKGLDTLAALGVDAIWLSPFYPSPQADFGYDVADYTAVDPTFGSLDDFDRLAEAVHARGMKLILDLVPNHTSDQHAWFQASRRSRSDPKRDWYIWSDPAPGGGPPNNWQACFGGSSWEWDAATRQYYLHSFLTSQPDLNWRNPEVVVAMHDAMRWWLDRGADGFRVDAIHYVLKDPALRDNPDGVLLGFNVMQPGIYDVVAGLRDVIDEYADRVLIGETGCETLEEYAGFLGDGASGFHLAFHFGLMFARAPADLRREIEAVYAVLHPDVWPTLVLSNHDFARIVSRLTPDGDADDRVARLAGAALLLTRGAPFIYQGEELGLADTRLPDELLVDPLGVYEREHGMLDCNVKVGAFGRDAERTPLPWTPSAPHAGFTTGTPWLPVADPTRNVATQRQAPSSVWQWFRRLIALRQARPALRAGDYIPTTQPGDRIWGFERRLGDDHVFVELELEPPFTVRVTCGRSGKALA